MPSCASTWRATGSRGCATVILDAGRAESFVTLAKQLDEAAAAGRRSEAVELYFTKVMQMPAPAVAGMRSSPMWAGLERLAHTIEEALGAGG
jgi:hypothetical protein